MNGNLCVSAKDIWCSSSRIQQRLQMVHGIAELIRATEELDDFTGLAVVGDRRDAEDV